MQSHKDCLYSKCYETSQTTVCKKNILEISDEDVIYLSVHFKEIIYTSDLELTILHNRSLYSDNIILTKGKEGGGYVCVCVGRQQQQRTQKPRVLRTWNMDSKNRVKDSSSESSGTKKDIRKKLNFKCNTTAFCEIEGGQSYLVVLSFNQTVCRWNCRINIWSLKL